MPYSLAEQYEVDRKLFGCSRYDLINNFERLIKHQSPSMGILSILSDIQELSLIGDSQSIHLKINQVKFLIDEYLVCKDIPILTNLER